MLFETSKFEAKSESQPMEKPLTGEALLSDCRVIYCAFGAPYVAMCLNSIASLKRHTPDVPVTVLSDLEIHPACPFFDDADSWVKLDISPDQNRLIKTSLPDYTKNTRNLFLDSDTVVMNDLSPMFSWLDRFDVGMALVARSMKESRQHNNARIFGGRIAIGDRPHWNSGVILFRKNALVSGFFKDWKDRFRNLGLPVDQPALVESVFESDIRLLSFDYRWNASYAEYVNPRLGEQVAVLHYTTVFDQWLRKSILDKASFIKGTGRPLEVASFIDQRIADRKRRGKGISFSKRVKRFLLQVARREPHGS
ncbi:MAG: glycosyltransferase [Pseudomonadota bacterium]